MYIIAQNLSPFFYDTIHALEEADVPLVVITGSSQKRSSKTTDWVKGPSYDRRSIGSRIRAWIKFFLFVLMRVWKFPSGSLVYVASNPPFVIHLILLFKPLKEFKILYRVLDIYPDCLNSVEAFRGKSIVFIAWSKINLWLYPRADKVITIGEVMRKRLGAYLKNSKIDVVPDWATIQCTDVPKRSDNVLRKELGLEHKKVILYSGNIGITHNLHILIEAAKLLIENSSLYFVIIGDGPAKKHLTRFADENNLSNVKFLPFQPFERLHETMGVGDFAVVSVDQDAAQTLMPCKTYDYMAAGNGILAIVGVDCDLSRVIQYSPVNGVVVKPEAGEIAKILSSPEFLGSADVFGRNSQIKIQRFFNKADSLSKVVKLLMGLAEGKEKYKIEAAYCNVNCC